MHEREEFGFLRQSLSRHRLLVAGIATVMLLQVALLVALPLPIRAALDRLTGSVNTPIPFGFEKGTYLAILTLSGLVLGLFCSVFEYLEDRSTSNLAKHVITELRTGLIHDVLTRKMEFLDRKRKVDLLGRISGDVQNLELYFTTLLSVLIRSLPSTIFIVGAMLFLEWRYALVLAVLLVGMAAMAIRLSRGIKRAEKKFRRASTAMEQDLLQSLMAMPLIKSFQAEGRTTSLLLAHQRTANEAYDEIRHQSGTLGGIFSASRHVLRSFVILVGGWEVLHGRLTLGTLFAFLAYLEAVAKPVMEIANCSSRINKASASLERIHEMKEELILAPESAGGKPLRVKKSAVPLALDHLSFGYDEGREIFDQLSLRFGQGPIALVGESGAGKSTLIRLLNRLAEPTEGRLLIDGQSAAESDLHDLRRAVGVVSQDPFLLSTSVSENLRWSLDEVLSEDDLWEALAQASAESFVRQLPQGLATPVGEGGLQLSGGQAKRISLARGFLRARVASILVFDEPTSGLDPVSAQSVMGAIEQLAEEKPLVLFSTHRLPEILGAKAVLFLPKGEAPVFGAHADLLLRSEAYRSFARELVEKTPAFASPVQAEALV